MCLAAPLLHESDQRHAVVSAIGDDAAWRKCPEQLRRDSLVGGLTRCDQQFYRKAILIDHSMDLGAQSATRTANGVIRTPFFPPAAC